MAHVKPPALQLRRRSGNSLYDYPSRYSSKRFLQAKRQKQQKCLVYFTLYWRVVTKIRSNILTDGNIRALVKVVDEQMDGVASDQRKKLQTIEKELADVRRRLDTIYNLVETTEVEMADFTPRIRQHRERQGRLEYSADQARAALAQRRNVLDDVNTIAAYAQDMSAFPEGE